MGKDPDALTDLESQNLKSAMVTDLYPGKEFRFGALPFSIENTFITGLDKSPEILLDTMLPNVSPETAAGRSVLKNGGYDPCQYGVSDKTLSFLIFFSKS